MVVHVDSSGRITTPNPYIGIVKGNNGEIKSEVSTSTSTAPVSFVKVEISGNAQKLDINIDSIVYEMACIYNNWVYYDTYGDIDLSKSYLEEIVDGRALLRDLKCSKRNADGSVYLYDIGSYENPMYFPYMTNFDIGLIWSEINEVHMICPRVTNMCRAFFDTTGLTSISFYQDKEKNKLNALVNVKDAFAMFGKN